jgi:hypothetical protein
MGPGYTPPLSHPLIQHGYQAKGIDGMDTLKDYKDTIKHIYLL